jgi:hypothetical protein
VLGGGVWIFVRTHIRNRDRAGYVHHDYINRSTGRARTTFRTNRGSRFSYHTRAPFRVPTPTEERAELRREGLLGRVRLVPNTATNRYNCHGFVFLNAMAWLNDPTRIIQDNGYFVPNRPQVGDVAAYTTTPLRVDRRRRPITRFREHSGLVTRGSVGNPTEVTSKWGTGSIAKHRPTDVPSVFGRPYYLRSRRAGGHTARMI